ncbi:phospholipid carrier-dependent glycosyltransferase [Mycobacterium hodleri]|uniref:Phospholipid carrier-dependent glycosyltransferase n=2 Tax=Mycolicibacterium hodleri TaxID=49897 RepID=A0A502EGA7_9MYCO|nr:phospholipid carrier-dependent glycosyltransferase [Mycolicibacterium hodleri]
MYLPNITVNGMGNQFYAAAAQAGSKNWEALLFGSLDTQNFMTVDKPPVSQWVMGLSGQIFGFSSASMLIPEALMAVATVALLYAAVRRISGPNAALLAGAAFALTPVAALMFRYNNPDAVMVLLMMAAVYCSVRALEHASARWIALAGAALGFAFLAKMLEGIMVMPAIGLVYLIAAPTTVGKRLLHLCGSLAAFLVAAGWFVALTLVWPASSRPYIAGSTDNNFMNLVLGYNGFARVLGNDSVGTRAFQLNPVIGATASTPFEVNHGHHGGFSGFGGDSQGLTRLFTGEFGFEIGWLLPAALLAFALVVVSRGRAPRTDPVRAGAIVFGVWMLVDGLVLSYMKTMVHPYYCLSFVPAVCAMVAIGVHEMWGRRDSWFGRGGLTAMVLGTGVWSWWILGRNAEWFPALRWAILAVTVAAALCLLVATTSVSRQRFAVAALAIGLSGGVLGAAAYSFATIGHSHNGGMAMVGPARSDGHRGGGWGQDADNPQLEAMLRATHTDFSAAINRSNAAAGLELSTDTAVMAIGGFGGSDPVPTLGEFELDVANHRIGYYVAPSQEHQPGGFSGRSAHPDISTWVAAHFTPTTVGSDTVYDLTAPAK